MGIISKIKDIFRSNNSNNFNFEKSIMLNLADEFRKDWIENKNARSKWMWMYNNSVGNRHPFLEWYATQELLLIQQNFESFSEFYNLKSEEIYAVIIKKCLNNNWHNYLTDIEEKYNYLLPDYLVYLIEHNLI